MNLFAIDNDDSSCSDFVDAGAICCSECEIDISLFNVIGCVSGDLAENRI